MEKVIVEVKDGESANEAPLPTVGDLIAFISSLSAAAEADVRNKTMRKSVQFSRSHRSPAALLVVLIEGNISACNLSQ